MTPQQRTLRISFELPRDFEQEYSANLITGGVFIPTDENFEARERVGVHLSLDFCDQSLLLFGEVVHRVDPTMASAGATPGVAIQLSGTAVELRRQLAPLVSASGDFQCAPLTLGDRDSLRVRARVLSHVKGGGFSVTGQSRNLSHSGILVDVLGEAIPIGQRVKITLHHPVSGETRDLAGHVVRQIESGGGITAIGIRFDPEVPDASDTRRFIEDVQQAEHSRSLGGIRGSLFDLKPPALLSMFGGAAPEGTLTLLGENEQRAVVGFKGGRICYARLGAVSGMKAIVRLFAWTEGTFEFHASFECLESMQDAIPLEAAIIDAARRIDEGTQIDATRFPPEVSPLLGGGADGLDSPTKVEAAVLDLVRAGFSVERIVEIIPEPDPEIYAALESLLEQSAITLP